MIKEHPGFKISEGIYIEGETSNMYRIKGGYYFEEYQYINNSHIGPEYKKALEALMRFYTDKEYVYSMLPGYTDSVDAKK